MLWHGYFSNHEYSATTSENLLIISVVLINVCLVNDATSSIENWLDPGGSYICPWIRYPCQTRLARIANYFTWTSQIDIHVCYYSMAIEVLSMVWQQQAEWRSTGIQFAETSRQRYNNNNFFWLKRPYLLAETSMKLGTFRPKSMAETDPGRNVPWPSRNACRHCTVLASFQFGSLTSWHGILLLLMLNASVWAPVSAQEVLAWNCACRLGVCTWCM